MFALVGGRVGEGLLMVVGGWQAAPDGDERSEWGEAIAGEAAGFSIYRLRLSLGADRLELGGE